MKTPDQKRRLAAIMFADVAGYTAMMQRNEKEGFAKVQRFSEVMESEVKTHEGEILEFRGDGCMVVFDSAVQAMHAAKSIQEQLRQEPTVPLRIGIHIGDIIFAKGSIYGDGVNLASRVESMGVPGSILVTERVIHDIKSHPEFEMTSLGKFQFKNVERPMEVFALANEGMIVPKPEEMKGKGEKVEEKKSNTKTVVRLASFGFVAMAIGAILFWGLGGRNAGSTDLLDKEIREEKVAVAIFENFTGDQNLDGIGYLASEWITSSLREIGIKTVAPEMMRQYKDYVGILPDNPEGKTSLAEVTKAQYVISGSYFPKGDSLRLMTRLLDTHTGEEVQEFPIIWARKSDPEGLVEEARQRLMGFWAMEKNQHFPKVQPPKYNAYQQYLKCQMFSLPCQMKVWELDSTFLLNRASMMVSSSLWGNTGIFLDSKRFVEKHWEEVTEYEKNIFRYSDAIWEGDFEKAFKALDLNYQADSQNLLMVHQSTFTALVNLNYPRIAYNRTNVLFSDYNTHKDQLHQDIFFRHVEAMRRLGMYEEIIDFVDSLPNGDWLKKANFRSWMELYMAYLEVGKYEEAIQYIDSLMIHANWVPIPSQAAYGWAAFHQDSLPNPFHDRIEERLNKGEYISYENSGVWNLRYLSNGGGPYMFKIYQPYLLGDWERAEKQFLSLRGTSPDLERLGEELISNLFKGIDFQVWVEATLGNIYARQGEKDQALQQLEILENMRGEYASHEFGLKRGVIAYYQARIYALLNEKERAVSLLAQSREEGKAIYMWDFTVDWELASLRGYEPYEKLIEVRE